LLILWGRRGALVEGRKLLDPAWHLSWNQWDRSKRRRRRARPEAVYIMPVKGYFERGIFAGLLVEGSLNQWNGAKRRAKNLLIIL
jgi:hypothetical protein